jgi:phosphohistidine phosphatase SixA
VITVLVVRHADIDLSSPGAPPPGPALTEAGRERSSLLARALADAGIATIVVSRYRRTRETAAPLAAEVGLDPDVVDQPATRAADILAGELGAVLLVVGHSDTIPELIETLGAGTVPAIEQDEFDNLYVVAISGPTSTVLHLHYGAETGVRRSNRPTRQTTAAPPHTRTKKPTMR